MNEYYYYKQYIEWTFEIYFVVLYFFFQRTTILGNNVHGLSVAMPEIFSIADVIKERETPYR